MIEKLEQVHDLILQSPLALLAGLAVLWYWKTKRREKLILWIGCMLCGLGLVYSMVWIVRGFPWNR
jgi:1,4-dihydroxy-2-naphthoate octaprenyltransferase